jgi:hypothetical protein
MSFAKQYRPHNIFSGVGFLGVAFLGIKKVFWSEARPRSSERSELVTAPSGQDAQRPRVLKRDLESVTRI